jgi:hypothetical protein
MIRSLFVGACSLYSILRIIFISIFCFMKIEIEIEIEIEIIYLQKTFKFLVSICIRKTIENYRKYYERVY